jgi:HK97 family phage portal protein
MARRVEVAEYRAPLPAPVERRDPSGATMPVKWHSPGQPMVPEWDAENAFRWGYYANVFVYACARAIASDLSRLPFRVGDPDTNTWNPAHPMAVHLSPPPGGPNPVTSARKLFAWSIIQYLITGRLGWEIETGSSDRPLAYWPLPSSMLRAIPSEGGASYFKSFEFGIPHDPKMLRPDQVFYTWEPSGTDWRQPESRLQASRLDVSVAVMQDRYDYAFLKNDARPAAIVVHERFALKEERDAWRAQFRANHQGPDNAGRAAFVETDGGDAGVAGSLDIKSLGLNQKDAEFIKRYDQKIRGIIIGFGVPMSRLGDSSQRTFSNAGEEMHSYWENTLLPIALDLADAMNMQLLPRYGTRNGGVGYFDTSGVAALKQGQNIAPITAGDLVGQGIASKNEGRAIVGLGRHDDPAFDQIDVSTPPAAVPSGLNPVLSLIPGAASSPKAKGGRR